MKTNIELKPEHRRALRAIAARRGEKSLASVLAEAIEHYLDREHVRTYRPTRLSSLAGSLSVKDAKDLRVATRSVRTTWR